MDCRRSLSFLALTVLLISSAAHASEDENPFNPRLPAVGPYDPNAVLVLPDIPEDGVVLDMPDPLRVVYRAGMNLRPSSLELWIDGVEYTEQLEFWGEHATLDLPSRQAWSEGVHTIYARILDQGGNPFEVFDDITIVADPCPSGCPWPFDDTGEPSVVSNLMEDWQDFGWPEYWHSGIDIRADAGTPVKSSTPGTVVKVINYRPTHPSSHLYWEVAVEDPDGFIWQYHHLEENSITVIEGQNILQGHVLGEVVPWTWSMNQHVYHHIHLNVVRWVGAGPLPGPYEDGFLYYNPLNFLTKGTYDDDVDPFKWDIFYADNEANAFFASDNAPGTPSLSGDVDVIARLHDQMTIIAPAEGQPYDLGIYRLAFDVDPVDTPCDAGYLPKQQLAKFDMVPGGSIIADQDIMLHAIYKETLGGGHGSRYDYAAQRFYYTLTNVKNGFPDGPDGFWNTDSNSAILGPRHPDGTYQVNIYATDWYGNESVFSTDVEVSNGLTFSGTFCPNTIDGFQWFDPIEIESLAGETFKHQSGFVPLSFSPLSEGRSTALVDETLWSPWVFDLPSRGLRVKIAPAPGAAVEVEYVPYLGDVILEIPAEMEVCGLTSGQTIDTQIVPLRLSTRLARDPWTAAGHIGSPDTQNTGEFRLVMAEEIDVLGEPMLLRSLPGGSRIDWLLATPVEADPTPTVPVAAHVRAFPNPFNPQVNIELILDRSVRVEVTVYDAAGRRVRQLHTGTLDAGPSTLSWNGTDATGARQASGVYYVRVVGEGIDHSTKIALLQ